MSDGSQSSIDIDMSQVNVILSNATHPMSSTARDRVRARARGHGHRRRISVAQARASRSSVYETIQEETASPAPTLPGSKLSSSPTACQGIYVVEPEAGSMDLSNNSPGWDDERGILALRKYYALRHEAEDTVTESKRTWSDTPFSMYALQSMYSFSARDSHLTFLQRSSPPSIRRACKRSSSTLSRTTARCPLSWVRVGCARAHSPVLRRILSPRKGRCHRQRCSALLLQS
jgi:hypothetical protein